MTILQLDHGAVRTGQLGLRLRDGMQAESGDFTMLLIDLGDAEL